MAIGCIDEGGAGEPIVEELAIAVEEGPCEAEAERYRSEYCDEKTMNRACDADGLAVPPHHADVPGLHGQGLAAARPEPHEIRAGDDQDPGLEQVAAPAVGRVAE